jgi:hypothetical protein
MPCPTCSCVALILRRTDDYVRCLTCSSQWANLLSMVYLPVTYDNLTFTESS